MAEPVVIFGGDVMFDKPVEHFRRAEDGFESVLAELDQSDLVVVNLEMPLSRRGYRVPKFANYRCDPEMIDDVKAVLGADAVSMANNHMMDWGPVAMLDTVEACDRVGIAHAGAGSDIDTAFAPAVLNCNGKRIEMMSAACTLPVESDAAVGKPGIAPVRVKFSFEVDISLVSEQPGTVPDVHTWVEEQTKEDLCRRIRDMKARADVAIVIMHWGVPSPWLSPAQGLLAEYQRPLAHAIIDAGADLIIGNHPHAINPVEIYRGKCICYSMGNFVYVDIWPFMGPESILARMSIDSGTVELVPILLSEQGIPHRATGGGAMRILTTVQEMSVPLGTAITIQNDRGYPRAVVTSAPDR
jgi:poly-gamma-glutamate capsule biosynthesis protein CapA/YwtB (metallophosphatase superfamily)